MRSIKAILAGSLFVIIFTLLMQLLYIFVAVGYNALARHYPLLNEITGVFRYLIGIPLFMLIMFAGGYVTAYVARSRVLLHSFIVGLITFGGLLLWALQNYQTTVTGLVVLVLALVSTTAGGYYWQRESKTEQG
jgi:hypothetical protein